MSIPEFRIAYHPGTGTWVCEHVVCAQCAIYNVTVPFNWQVTQGEHIWDW